MHRFDMLCCVCRVPAEQKCSLSVLLSPAGPACHHTQWQVAGTMARGADSPSSAGPCRCWASVRRLHMELRLPRRNSMVLSCTCASCCFHIQWQPVSRLSTSEAGGVLGGNSATPLLASVWLSICSRVCYSLLWCLSCRLRVRFGAMITHMLLRACLALQRLYNDYLKTICAVYASQMLLVSCACYLASVLVASRSRFWNDLAALPVASFTARSVWRWSPRPHGLR